MHRREFFSWARNGLAGAAAASLLMREGTLLAGVPGESSPPCPHVEPKAKRAIHICLSGALSHLDSFDHKPGLVAAHGQSLESKDKPDVFFGQVGRCASPIGSSSLAARVVSGSPTSSRTSRSWPTS